MDVGVRLKGWEAQVLGYRTERMGGSEQKSQKDIAHLL